MGSLFGSSKSKSFSEIRPVPVVDSSAAQPPDAEQLRQAGRAGILFNTSVKGVLGKPKTGRSQLLSS